MALNMISAEELYYEPLDQDATEMIIEDMIPKGLTLLAGAPKSGKSWMALDMALAVSSGRDFLQRQTKSCGVIYLTLEDSMERVQKRLLNISESPPGNLHICIETKTMGQGFLKELADTLENYPDTGLIIIDILQKIRDYESTSASDLYGREEKEMSAIKSFADRRGIGIVCVTHLKKMQDRRDPVNEILGSTAMSGVSDQILLLRKDRVMTCGELTAVGRDSPQWKMILRFDNTRWHLVSQESEEDLAKEQIPDVLFQIRDHVLKEGKWIGTASQLLDVIGVTDMAPHVLSGKMTKFYHEVFHPEGIIMKSKRTSRERLITLEHVPEGTVKEDVALLEQSVEDNTEDSTEDIMDRSQWNESVAAAKQILHRSETERGEKPESVYSH